MSGTESVIDDDGAGRTKNPLRRPVVAGSDEAEDGLTIFRESPVCRENGPGTLTRLPESHVGTEDRENGGVGEEGMVILGLQPDGPRSPAAFV